MELSEYMVEKIKASPDKYYLILEPEMVNVSFWYVPKRLRNIPHSPKRAESLGQVWVYLSNYNSIKFIRICMQHKYVIMSKVLAADVFTESNKNGKLLGIYLYYNRHMSICTYINSLTQIWYKL